MSESRINFMRKAIAVWLLIVAASSALANGASVGVVTVPLVLSDSGVFMFMAGTPSGQPSCERIPSQPWVLNVKTDGGKATYSMLLVAYSQGKTVTVYGNGLCDVWGDRETVTAISVN
jgi:hypothetical protein